MFLFTTQTSLCPRVSPFARTRTLRLRIFTQSTGTPPLAPLAVAMTAGGQPLKAIVEKLDADSSGRGTYLCNSSVTRQLSDKT